MIVIEDIINNVAISVNEISDDITISVSETSTLVNIEVAEIGLKGDKGEQGIQGIQGIQGEIGATGANGTTQDISVKVDKVAGERLINAAEITKLGSQSGTNTGDQNLNDFSKFLQVSSYTALKSLPTQTNLTIIKVLNDENKGITNAIYHIYPDGVRMWIASTQDN